MAEQPPGTGTVRTIRPGPSREAKALTYLVVDDNRFARTIIKSSLGSFGIDKVVEAANAIEAVKILRDGGIDFLLVDYEMPGITGAELTRIVRSGQEPRVRSDLPIVMVTGYTDREIVMDSLQSGITGLLAKPVAPNDLIKRIEQALRTPGRTMKDRMAEAGTAGDKGPGGRA